MTSRKRRASLPENNPKPQKINKSESQSSASTKKNAVTGTARKLPPSTQKKITPKAIAKKAIKNSELSKQEAVRKKSTILKATKNSAAKNVPTKGKSVRLAKEGTTTKKGIQKPSKSSKSPAVKQVKTVQSVRKNVNTKKKTSIKAAGLKKNAKNSTQSKSSQNKTKKDDLQQKQVGSNPKKKTPVKAAAAAKQSKPVRKSKQAPSKTTGKQAKLAPKAKQAPAKGTDNRSKLEPKAKQTLVKVGAKQIKLKPRAKRTLVKTTDKKSKCNSNTKQAQVKGAAEKSKSKKAPARTCDKKSNFDPKESRAVVQATGKDSKLGPKAKQAQAKVTDKQPELKHKPKGDKQVHASAKASAQKTRNKPLQPATQQSANPEQSEKRLKSKPTRGRPKSSAHKNSQLKTETCLEDTKESCFLSGAKKGLTESVVSHIPLAKDVTVGNVSSSKCDSKQALNSCNGKIPKKGKIVGNTPSQVTLKRKRNSTKPADGTAKNKAKKPKIVQSESKNKVMPSEDDQKTKRVSILDLCNEIAGEIESDTVEVIKERPGSPTIEEQVEEHPKAQDQDMSPPPAERSPANQSKRFFPSRKPLQIKCKLEQRTSPGTKNSKWKKIKLKKSFSEHNLVKRAVLPSLEAIKTKGSTIRQLASDSHKPVNSKSITALATPTKPSQPAVSKNTTLTLKNKDTVAKTPTENGLLENHLVHDHEEALDEGFRLHLDSSPENSPVKKVPVSSPPPETTPPTKQSNDCKQLMDQMAASADKGTATKPSLPETKSVSPASNTNIQKEIRKLKEADKVSSKQPIIDAGQKRFGAISCSVCGMLYTATNPEDEAQHLLFHNQFISAVKYVGWKKERIVAEYPDGKVIMVLPDDPKYALKKVEEIREMVDNDLGFQQVPLWLHPRTKTFLFISTDKKIVGCLISEHIQRGYRVIEDFNPGILSDTDRLFSERVKAWCCSTTPEPAICGVSRIWVFSLMRRKKIASRMLECVRNHFIYGSHLNKDEIAFSDPTPDGKLFAAQYCGTSQFLVYNFVSGHHPLS
ncbi:N-acetyltransferase ESCO1 isoform X2 [Hyperolius riggenbachi]